jgi:hypothetical protein
MAHEIMDHVASHMGASDTKPPKVVHHVEVHHSATKGDHIVTHHHTHPDHHPSEKHTTRGDDELTSHLMATMGTPNEGETPATGPATPPDASAGAAAGAAPNAAAGAAPMPAAM